MAGKPKRLTVSVSRRAQRDLDEIWDYNADFYGSANHADRYLEFLEEETQRLGTEHSLGKPVPHRDGLFYMTMRRGRGHGHVTIYEIVDEVVIILRYFHTRQDWSGRI